MLKQAFGNDKKQIDGLDIPRTDEFLEMIDAGDGEIYACKLAVDMFKIKKEDLVDKVKDIITIGEIYKMVDGLQTQLIFS